MSLDYSNINWSLICRERINIIDRFDWDLDWDWDPDRDFNIDWNENFQVVELFIKTERSRERGQLLNWKNFKISVIINEGFLLFFDQQHKKALSNKNNNIEILFIPKIREK